MSQEVHILHEFPSDFYDQNMRVLVMGYIRPEKNYESVGTQSLFTRAP